MFNWIKNILGLTTTVEDNDVGVILPKPDVEEVAACCAGKTDAVAKETRESLRAMTKTDIDALAKERFGVDLDRRKTKDTLIEDFLKAQEQH
jgi:hypothetical protein